MKHLYWIIPTGALLGALAALLFGGRSAKASDENASMAAALSSTNHDLEVEAPAASVSTAASTEPSHVSEPPAEAPQDSDFSENNERTFLLPQPGPAPASQPSYLEVAPTSPLAHKPPASLIQYNSFKQYYFIDQPGVRYFNPGVSIYLGPGWWYTRGIGLVNIGWYGPGRPFPAVLPAGAYMRAEANLSAARRTINLEAIQSSYTGCADSWKAHQPAAVAALSSVSRTGLPRRGPGIRDPHDLRRNLIVPRRSIAEHRQAVQREQRKAQGRPTYRRPPA